MKKKSSFLLLVVAIFISNLSDAQNFSLGVRSGLSIPNLTAGGSESNPLNTGYKSRLGPDEAITGEYHLSSLFSLEAMLEYSSQGGKKTGMQAFPTPSAMAAMFPPGEAPTYLYANFKSEAKLNYLLVPILAKFGWKLSSHSPVRIFFDAGPFAGFLLSAHQVTSGSSMIYLDQQGQQPASQSPQSFDANNDIKDQLNTFNFGVSGNVGFAYNFAKSNIYIEGGGNYGFLNIQKGTANGKNNTGAGTIALGYAYTFGK
ncbi:MAG TPA: outer membrane beta-barrel protein [Hanamia sp.]|nr:outer membrane beta-barrel protein [Hanamia sp.]